MMDNFEIFNNVLKKYHGNETVVYVPDGLDEIADFAFYDCANLEKVVIPSSVTMVGSYCFNNCINLKEVVFSENMTYLGSGAFSSCFSLETITLPDRLRTIQKSTFYKCNLLKDVNLPKYLVQIDHSAFSYCTSLTHISFPENLKGIGDSVFEECTALKEIIFPHSLEKLGKKVFFHCPELRKIVLDENIKSIDEGAFQTHGKLQLISNETFKLTSKMFDCNWNLNWGYSFKMKNGDNYVLENSYLPHLDFAMFKPMAKTVLIVNFFETINRHMTSDRDMYIQNAIQLKKDVLDFIVDTKRFDALNNALEHKVYSIDDIEPYFEFIVDREQKAKILAYREYEKKEDSLFDDLDDLF